MNKRTDDTPRDSWRFNYHFGYARCDRAIVHLLVILFGVSTWIGVNGIFIELPLLVGIAPEGWNLPAYIVIVAQSANVGPAIYAVLHKSKCQPNESLCILCLLCSQVLAMGSLIFFYDRTLVIGGERHSLILLVSVFFSALVGCFSSVLFMPYLRDFDDVYIVSYFVGEGLSGVLPSVAALIQDVGERATCYTPLANATAGIPPGAFPELKFPEQYYFLFLTLVLVLSLIAFIVLRYSPFVQVSRCRHDSDFLAQTKADCKTRGITVNVHGINVVDRTSAEKNNEMPNGSSAFDAAKSSPVFRKFYLYILIGVCCFFSNGFLPSIQSYSCLPYGHLAYQLSIVCSQFVNPLACFLTIWIMASDIKIINCLSLLSLIAGCYVISVALLSPTPPLQKSTVGIGLIILSWIILMGVISYLKLVIVSLLKHISSSKALFNIGVVMQTGSAGGAITSFVLINFTDWFKTYSSCSENNY
ncbi:riboflavin transporter 2 [Monomorium pharaonis]|uniref:riboflavin transporter 2 n=1 Tax=Monomorium pharaonis TaxID=307658 RepID=UPI00063F0769|nr:riboflavin transporter 2 [Monomorium pharaonis]XP_012535355.1 riboflavin transporter 2 [Monomorium pharaonis]